MTHRFGDTMLMLDYAYSFNNDTRGTNEVMLWVSGEFWCLSFGLPPTRQPPAVGARSIRLVVVSVRTRVEPGRGPNR